MAASSTAASADSCVRIVSTCSVRPSRSTAAEHRHMFLAAPDIVWRLFPYFLRILFYKLPDGEHDSYEAVIEQLKRGLADALLEFYPVAGRLFQQPEDGRLALLCNDAGVPFIEASCDIPFSSLQADGFQYKPFFKHLAPHADVARWTGSDLPLFSVQVTRFSREEGFALGFGYNHTLGDGTSQWHFMKSWSECARGLPISMRPVHMRDALHPKNLILPQPQLQGGESNTKSLTQGETFDICLFKSTNAECVHHAFHFTAKMVQKLKQKAMSSSLEREHAPFSSLQALSAHIWKHVIAAMELEKSKKTAFHIVANMRARLVPPLPEAYYGNAATRNIAIVTREELERESMGAIALRIQEAIKLIDDTRMKSFYGKLETMDPRKFFEASFDSSMTTLLVSSSPRFPIYDVDFGWGPPVSVRCPIIHHNGEIVLFPGPQGGGSVDVCLALSHPVMERLKQDEGFLPF